MTQPTLMPLPKQQILSAQGAPLAGGKVYTYAAGGTTPKATYTSAAATEEQPNPIPLNARGEPSTPIYWNGVYRVDIRDSLGNLVYTADNYNSDPFNLAQLFSTAGLSLLNFLQTGSTYVRSLLDKLRDNVNIKDFGALGDGSDATAAFVKASAYSRVRVSAGVYVLDSVELLNDVTFECEPGTIFRRKAGADGSQFGYSRMSGMFTMKTNGLKVRFVGSMSFDGNYQNQTTVEPGGCAIFVTIPANVTSAPVSLYVENAYFYGATSEALMIRGDDVRRRYRTDIELVNCSFGSGVYGIGKSDPSTPNALGYTPSYVHVLDYVILRTYDFRAWFDRPLSLGKYAPVAIWGSYAGADYTQAGNCSILMYGRTEVTSVGRASWKYNDQTEFVTNNGLGCIDCYGNADELYVEDIHARDSQYSPVRAKGSCRVVTVQHADFDNCWRGIEVSPSSTGPCETVVHIGKVTAKGGTMPAIYCTGSSPTDQLYSVDISSAYLFGTSTNPENLVNQGHVVLKNTAKATARAVSVIGCASNAMVVDTVDRAHIGELITNNNGGNAVRVYGTGQFILDKFDIRNCGSNGVYITPGMADVTIRGGKMDNVVDYGILNQATGNITVQNVTVSNVTGLGRGFYNAAGSYAVMLGNIAMTGVATPMFPVTGVFLREQHNSWNPREVYGSFTMTTVGTWGVGDKVWYTTPTAGQAPGRICVAAGSPGTWKDMASIAA